MQSKDFWDSYAMNFFLSYFVFSFYFIFAYLFIYLFASYLATEKCSILHCYLFPRRRYAPVFPASLLFWK